MGSTEAEPREDNHYASHLPDLTSPRFTTMKQQDPYVYTKEFKEGGRPPWLHALWKLWLELLEEPFKGVTNDGRVRPDLFKLQDEGVPIDEIVAATNHVLSQLSPEQSRKVLYHIDSPEWRSWSNPEFLLFDKGVRLDELTPDLRDSILKVLQLTLSREGYQKAVSAMRINGFLGDLVESPTIMNEYSYNFCLFGKPSSTMPWGISFYGHHLCLNIFLVGHQLIISPWFTGAEPNEIDSGPHQGTRILVNEERLGLQLMQSLGPHQQSQVQLFAQMLDPKMPVGRWNHDDQRHLCGAYRDNRVVPYEGLPLSILPSTARELVWQILDEYLLYLPEQSRKMKLEQCKAHFLETYFCWIGGFGPEDPFYYRIQSPVIVVEFDHHSGVFLTNAFPAKFHTHTLLRTPNGGDYGYALRPLVKGEVKQEFIWKEPGIGDEEIRERDMTRM